MTDNEYTSMGENPGIALTTCTGCGTAGGFGETRPTHCHNCGKPWAEAEAAALFPVQQPGVTAATNGVPFSKPPRIAPDECVVSRELLQAVRAAIWEQVDLFHSEGGEHWDDARDLLRRIDAALAASGDDGGTP